MYRISLFDSGFGLYIPNYIQFTWLFFDYQKNSLLSFDLKGYFISTLKLGNSTGPRMTKQPRLDTRSFYQNNLNFIQRISRISPFSPFSLN